MVAEGCITGKRHTKNKIHNINGKFQVKEVNEKVSVEKKTITMSETK